MNYLLKISEGDAFHVNDEHNTALGGPVCLREHISPPGEICLFINCPKKSQNIFAE